MRDNCEFNNNNKYGFLSITAEARTRGLPIPEVPNPLYETGGPIYEEIPGQKMMFNTLAKPQPLEAHPVTPSAEYITMEGKHEEARHYDSVCITGILCTAYLAGCYVHAP